jgi:xylulokinase
MDPNLILALGGASRSSVWNRIKADVAQRTYSRPRVPAAASLGGFMLACKGLGIEAGTAEGLNPAEAQWAPDPGAGPIYDEMFSRYEKLYLATAPTSGRRC